MSSPSDTDRARRVVGSMMWAAWADALGFISELTSEAGLRRRLKGRPLTEPVEWTRRVGGKFGVEATLPAGCYSDDTQLRLATARAVHGTGFDVEAFARIELTVWPTYALGGGRASKTAATQMAKPSVPWFGNFYDGCLNAGGNGVAMRIQPHVWAASYPATLGQHVLDVIANGAISHGHPRALVGAVLHALSLGVTLEEGQVPSPDRWPELLDQTEQSVKLIDGHPQLAPLWRPAWEKMAGTSLADAWKHTVNECREMLPEAAQMATALRGKANDLGADMASGAYHHLVSAFELQDPEKRGSATTTVVAALALAAAFPANPADAARLASQAVGTDTDTIATMAAALIGATDAAPDPLPVLDADYLTAEATRLSQIAAGKATMPFSYPDLLHWVPPHTQLDAVGITGDRIALAGLGWLEEIKGTKPYEARDNRWVWTRSDFGASFLVKTRPEPRKLPGTQWPVRRERLIGSGTRHARSDIQADQLSFDDNTAMAPPHVELGTGDPLHAKNERGAAGRPMTNHGPVDIDQMLEWVARNRYSEEAVGYATRRVAQLGTSEQLVAFAMAVRAAIRDPAR